MKKALSIFLAMLLSCAIFAGCGDTKTNSTDSNQADSSAVAVDPAQSESKAPVIQEEIEGFDNLDNINPFTGYEKAEDYPDGQRAVAVMINNRKPALPHKGTSQADVIYEMVTEGGITRLMAVFSDYNKMPDVGMIRSARDQFVQLMFPYQAMYVHIGESTLAQDMMDRYQYTPQNLDGKVFGSLWWMGEKRDPTCYTCFTNGDLVKKTIENNSDRFDDNFEAAPIFNFVHYNEAPRIPADGPAINTHIQFSSEYYADLSYDSAAKKYLKFDSMGRAQLDEDNNQQLAFDNVLILFADMHQRENSPLTYVNFELGGYGYYLSQGQYEYIRWCKDAPHLPLRIIDLEGKSIDQKINCGKSYIAFTDLNTMFDQFNIDGVHPYFEAKKAEAE